MPIYEYECRGCGHQFEFLVLPKTTARCPSCEGEDLERMLSLFAVSSEGTRQANLDAARKKSGKVYREKQIEEEKYRHRIMTEDG